MTKKTINWLDEHDKKIPSCTDEKTYKTWRAMLPLAIRSGFCTDCTPEFQNEMIQAGKCDHPECIFFIDNFGSLEGTLFNYPMTHEVVVHNQRIIRMEEK